MNEQQQQSLKNEVIKTVNSIHRCQNKVGLCLFVFECFALGVRRVTNKQEVELTDEEIRFLWQKTFPPACLVTTILARHGTPHDLVVRLLVELSEMQALSYLESGIYFSE